MQHIIISSLIGLNWSADFKCHKTTVLFWFLTSFMFQVAF